MNISIYVVLIIIKISGHEDEGDSDGRHKAGNCARY